MKDVAISLTISNGDVSTMLVEGYIEKLQGQLNGLQARRRTVYSNFLIKMGELDDAICTSPPIEAERKALQKALNTMTKSFPGFKSVVAPTWRQAEKRGAEFYWKETSSRDKRIAQPTSELMTFFWLSELFGFSYSFGIDTFGMDLRVSSAQLAVGDPKAFVLPWPCTGFAKYSLSESRARSTFVVTPEIQVVADQAELILDELLVLDKEIEVVKTEIADPAKITRQVTARLTQSALGNMEDNAFMKNVIQSIGKPLQLGLTDE